MNIFSCYKCIVRSDVVRRGGEEGRNTSYLSLLMGHVIVCWWSYSVGFGSHFQHNNNNNSNQ